MTGGNISSMYPDRRQAMSRTCLRNHLSLRNFLSLLCAGLTLLLIYKELVTVTVIKPTTTSTERKELETSDLPDIVVCFLPGFDPQVMRRYHYATGGYYKGENEEGHFVGWNGGGGIGNNKSSQKILDEILTFKSSLLNHPEKLFYESHFTAENVEQVPAEFEPKMLAYPYGRCLALRPAAQNATNHKKLNSLRLRLNDDAFLQNKTMRIFLMEKVNGLQIYPNEMEMTGDRIEIKLKQHPSLTTSYKTQIFRSQHIEGDPRFKCSVYSENSSYNDCVQKDLLGRFKNEIGCQPPLLVKDKTRICNEEFNITDAKRAERISKLFEHLYFHDIDFKCRTPCSSNVYQTIFVQEAQHERTSLVITFDNAVEIKHADLSIDAQTFLTRLGGSVSSGRTLLWMFLTLLGAFQVHFYHHRLSLHPR